MSTACTLYPYISIIDCLKVHLGGINSRRASLQRTVAYRGCCVSGAALALATVHAAALLLVIIPADEYSRVSVQTSAGTSILIGNVWSNPV